MSGNEAQAPSPARGMPAALIGFGLALIGLALALIVTIAGLDCVVLNTRIIDVDRLNELEAVCQRHGVSLLRLQINVKPFVAVS